MTLILDIINGFHKILSSLDISPKYLNRAYTILSLFPTLYVLRIVYGLWQNQNYFQFVIYLLIFIVLLYFVVLNFVYYFFDKNVKGDVTQLFVKVLPDDVFNIEENSQISQTLMPNTTEAEINYVDDYIIRLEENISQLIQEEKIPTNTLKDEDGFVIMKNTLHPYYYLKQISEDSYDLEIGTTFQDLEKIGSVHAAETPDPLGLFIVGGDFVKDGLRYHERYHLKLILKDKVKTANETEQVTSQTGSRSQRHKKKK